MIIQASAMDMATRRTYYSTYRKKETLATWGGETTSNQSKVAQKQIHVNKEERATDYETVMRKIRRSLFDYLFRIILGKDASDLELEGFEGTDSDFERSLQGAGGQYTKEELYTESEFTSFQTAGVVKTADGRTIDFNVNVYMSRMFMQYSKESISFGDPLQVRDPLVINLDSNIVTVSDQTFYFDLDADGKKDKINGLSGGSGFLALDKNADGIINDGNELFGTKSGDGFADLSAYDGDGNGWIDEADEVFNKLKVWFIDGSGKNRQISLKEAGVGAICLMNQDTQFTLMGHKTAVPNAYIRKTGIFLYESGMAGTVQHLDLVKH